MSELVAAFEQAYFLVPSDTGLLNTRALALLQAGHFVKARRLAEEVLQEATSETTLEDATQILDLANKQDAEGGCHLAFRITKRNYTGVKTE